MASLVNAFQGFVRAPGLRTTRVEAEAEERRIVFAVLLLFLVGGLAVAFYGLAQASVWA
jgi:hypothetical protein